jgi:hypothetical protein
VSGLVSYSGQGPIPLFLSAISFLMAESFFDEFRHAEKRLAVLESGYVFLRSSKALKQGREAICCKSAQLSPCSVLSVSVNSANCSIFFYFRLQARMRL